ncbi:hypothetical protein D3C72_520000 [compost metagenome]
MKNAGEEFCRRLKQIGQVDEPVLIDEGSASIEELWVQLHRDTGPKDRRCLGRQILGAGQIQPVEPTVEGLLERISLGGMIGAPEPLDHRMHGLALGYRFRPPQPAELPGHVGREVHLGRSRPPRHPMAIMADVAGHSRRQSLTCGCCDRRFQSLSQAGRCDANVLSVDPVRVQNPEHLFHPRPLSSPAGPLGSQPSFRLPPAGRHVP